MISSLAQELMTTKGFVNKYFDLLTLKKTARDAYEAVEIMYKKEFGRNRYSNYECFKSILTRYLKNGKKNCA